MKNSVLTLIIIAFATVSCNQKNNESKPEIGTESAEQMYSCPMHPEITGKKGTACSRCGMELTELVEKADEKQ